MHQRIWGWLLFVVLAASLALNEYQHSAWGSTYNYWASQYRLDIDWAGRSASALNSTERSGLMYQIWTAPAQERQIGQTLDVMVQGGVPRRTEILERVGADLSVFTRAIWEKAGLQSPVIDSATNDILPADRITQLTRIYAVYAKHVTPVVVKSRNWTAQQKALYEAHQELKSEGLDQILSPNIQSILDD